MDAIAAVTGVEAGLKWPNDVLADGGKLAGILAEVAAAQRAIVVGIGLNVTLRADEVPDADATSLRTLGGEHPTGTDWRGQCCRSWHDASSAGAVRTAPTPALIADYRAHSVTIGSAVRATSPAAARWSARHARSTNRAGCGIDIGGRTCRGVGRRHRASCRAAA